MKNFLSFILFTIITTLLFKIAASVFISTSTEANQATDMETNATILNDTIPNEHLGIFEITSIDEERDNISNLTTVNTVTSNPSFIENFLAKYESVLDECGDIIQTVRNLTTDADDLVKKYSVSLSCRELNKKLQFEILNNNNTSESDNLLITEKYLISTDNIILDIPINVYWIGENLTNYDDNLVQDIKLTTNQICEKISFIAFEIFRTDGLKLTPTIHIVLQSLISSAICSTKCATYTMKEAMRKSRLKVENDWNYTWTEFNDVNCIEMFVSPLDDNRSIGDVVANKEFEITFEFVKNETSV